MGTYIVQKGDTLSALAKQFRGDPEGWRDIAAVNQLKNPNRLQIGQALEIEGYTPPEDMPLPQTSPRREYSQSRGNAFGAPPVSEPLPPMGPSARAMGAEEMAIPEKPTFDDTVSAMRERFGDVQIGGISAEDTAWAADNQPEVEPLLTRGVEQAQPGMNMGGGRPDPTQQTIEQLSRFDPEQHDKINTILGAFVDGSTLLDDIYNAVLKMTGGSPAI